MLKVQLDKVLSKTYGWATGSCPPWPEVYRPPPFFAFQKWQFQIWCATMTTGIMGTWHEALKPTTRHRKCVYWLPEVTFSYRKWLFFARFCRVFTKIRFFGLLVAKSPTSSTQLVLQVDVWWQLMMWQKRNIPFCMCYLTHVDFLIRNSCDHDFWQ